MDPLLPLVPEPEDRWRTLCAVTEVLGDSSLRFVQFTRLTLPEPGPDEADELPAFVLDTPTARLTALRARLIARPTTRSTIASTRRPTGGGSA